jgi:hypothetical protein
VAKQFHKIQDYHSCCAPAAERQKQLKDSVTRIAEEKLLFKDASSKKLEKQEFRQATYHKWRCKLG